MLASMTGFARERGELNGTAWEWEIKSVNARGLDIRIRLPGGNDDVELAARAAIGKMFKRGSINASLNLQRNSGESSLQVNRAFLQQLIDVAREMGREDPQVETLFGVRGVGEPQEAERNEDEEAACREAFLKSFSVALDALKAARLSEGRKLRVMLEARLSEMEALVVAAEAAANERQESARDRLASQVAAMLEATNVVTEERLAQELAIHCVPNRTISR